MALQIDPAREQEKQAVAMNSALAAGFLTLMKIAVGLWSGSLGILAEAAHSGLDLVAAVVTLVAVRMAGRPADSEHHYGHGKIENLSAMVEALLLLGTCGWIIKEAVERLGSRPSHVDASIWAFGVVIVSILVDISRSRMLYKAAAKHKSQALEADALHFSSDIWSSAVVLVGLLGVKAASWHPEWGFMVKADAVSALAVAALVVVVSLRLGLRTIQGLMDTAPAGVADRIKLAVEAVEGVHDCHAVRMRDSGAHAFVDLHVLLDGNMTLNAAHALTDRIEDVVQGILPGADVTVHPEPRPEGDPGPEV
jgi:cation diffusion facilitator family transporter